MSKRKTTTTTTFNQSFHYRHQQSPHQTKKHGNDADVLIETYGWQLQSADWNPPYDEGIFWYQLQILFFLALRSLSKDYTPGKFTNVTQKRDHFNPGNDHLNQPLIFRGYLLVFGKFWKLGTAVHGMAMKRGARKQDGNWKNCAVPKKTWSKIIQSNGCLLIADIMQ